MPSTAYSPNWGPRIDAVGHRVVHGGDRFRAATIIDDAVEQAIEELSPLAPLHNPAALAGIRAARRALPDVPHVAVFDTAFHHTLPPAAFTYAIDAELAAAHHIRRYGFHGTSYRIVGERAAQLLERPLADLRMVVLHLGNGASVAAVSGGRSVDTSMGLTPLEGLVMGTRSGDIDPAVLIYLARNAGMTTDELDDLLNRRSGLLGLAGRADMRELVDAAESGDPAARLALDVYLHRIRHYIGAYAAEMGGLDAVVFTAGVGENSAVVRAGSVAGLEFLGIRLDAAANQSPSRAPRSVAAAGSRVEVLVVPTDEERQIARETVAAILVGA
ncbi:acetate kinase [Pseudolysinimonas kribbensis]|uniref:Acetate kinase n=1 Tax=Pseudolysinimonas kribbensis TaxID=433641 RepID=A0ABQ6K1Z7_9MICO|nr:acetate kinase [Pseudolysinimonas kribbensis]